MVKKLLISTVAVATLSTSAFAENEFGVGVSVNGNVSTVRADMKLGNDLRIEPFLSFISSDLRADNITLGAAVHLLKPINSNLNAYFGAYAGIVDRTYTNFYMGPVAGVEYSLDKQFTLGAEVSFDLGFGDFTDIGTNSEILLRYYF